MHSSLSLPIVAILLILAANSQANTRASYGEICDKNTRCDSRSSLSCSLTGICQCIKPEEMTYDSKRDKCVVLSGERCSYTAVEIMDTSTTQEKRWTERLDCVENANCNNDGYCDCRSEYFESSEGLCTPKGLNEANCTSNVECRVDKQLVCTNGMCSCNVTEAVFDSTKQACTARVGYSGMKYNGCVQNAYSPYRSYYSYSSGYDPNNEQWLCRCSNGYKQSKTGLCLANYGMGCNVKSAPCAEDWACVTGKCACQYPDHQFYDTAKRECVSYVRGPCLEQVAQAKTGNVLLSFSCDLNSECRNDTGVNKCLCKEGFIESESRKCQIAHGQTCEDQATSTSTPCDKVAKLVCRNGKCSCADFQIYDSSTQICKGLEGAKCANDAFCVDGAVCKAYRDATLGGVCACLPGFEITSERKCSVVRELEIVVGEVIETGTTEELVQNELIMPV